MPTTMTLIDSLHRRADALAKAPVLSSLVRKQALKRFLANRDQNLFFGVFPTWEAANEAARSYGASGYDNAASAQLYVHTTRIQPHDYPALYWLMRSRDDGMKSVFDVGGATGIKFLAFREPLTRWPDLRWRVNDVAAMVDKGRALSIERGDSNQLDFTDRFADGDGFDILLASGVLQYLPSTLAQMLPTYRQRPRRIIINTAAIHPTLDYFTVNSIGTAFCPYRIQSHASLVRSLGELGYKVRETWINPGKAMPIYLEPGYSLSDYAGYCLDDGR